MSFILVMKFLMCFNICFSLFLLGCQKPIGERLSMENLSNDDYGNRIYFYDNSQLVFFSDKDFELQHFGGFKNVFSTTDHYEVRCYLNDEEVLFFVPKRENSSEEGGVCIVCFEQVSKYGFLDNDSVARIIGSKDYSGFLEICDIVLKKNE